MKVVIIGSGLGGLSCGAILARNGYAVTVLEQGNQPGGCLQCFTRGGIRFETGMHFIGSAAPGETLHKMMRWLEMDDVKLSPLDRNAYDIVTLQGEHFAFANGKEAFIDRMASYFPKEKDNLAKYYGIIENIAGASSLHSLRYAETTDMLDVHYQTVSIDEVMREIFDDEMLCNVLVGNLPLYAAEKGKTPFSQHAFIMDFYNRSSFRIVGGSDNISKSLIKTIEKYGGKVLTGRKVTKIITDDTRATGVEVNHEEFIGADIVISAIHPQRTMELTESHLLRPAFRKRISSIPNTVGGFSVYVKFKPGTMPYVNSNLYGYRQDTPWDCEKYTEAEWPKGYLLMHFCESEHMKYATGGVILSYMQIADLARWKDTSVGHRGADYEAFKQEKAHRLLECLEKDLPGFMDTVESFYTSTPLTYRDYTGSEGGAMYGIAKDINMGAAARVPHKTRIPNLLLSGQNINSHGMLGVLVGSIVTCSELLKAEKIYRQISEANS